MDTPFFIDEIKEIAISFKAREFTSNDIMAELFKRGLCGESINKQALVWNAMSYLRKNLIISLVRERSGKVPAVYHLSDLMFSTCHGEMYRKQRTLELNPTNNYDTGWTHRS